MMRLPAFSFLLFLNLSPVLAASDHWPGWRGPTGMGQTNERDLPLTWDGKTSANVLWKSPLFSSDKVRRDQNQSSPIVWDQHVFVTVSYWPEGVSEKEFPEHHVLCFRACDGHKLWDVVVPPGPWKLTDLRGGYTAPTPVCDGQHVYVSFGSSVLAALDYSGKVVWRKEITPHYYDVALGASPILFKDTVILVCDQLRKASCIKAFAAATGDLRWEQKRPGVDWAHSTPVVARWQGKPRLFVATANGPQILDAEDGKTLWGYKTSDRVGDTVSPLFHDGRIYIDSGRGGAALNVETSGNGEVDKSHLKWSIKVVSEGFSSPVVVGDSMYRPHGPELLSCWKWSSGEQVFKERLPGLDHAISPVAAQDGKIYLASAGKSYVLQAGPKLKILATNDLGDPGKASPAVAAGKIYLKGGRYLFCIGKKQP